jgi:hypothetical protein
VDLFAADSRILGATATATLTNIDNHIVGAGQIGDGQMILVNKTAGVIDANGHAAMVIDTGANSINNFGLIEATGVGGMTIQSTIFNYGQLAATNATLTVAGAVGGTGSAVIGQGGELIFDLGFRQAVSFTGKSGELVLAKSRGYTGAISGFSTKGGTSLDLEDIAFAGAKVSYSGDSTSGTLTVTSGVEVATFTLEGNFTASTFVLSKDAGGGTVVIDPTAAAILAPSPTPLTQAIASFQVSPPPGVAGPPAWQVPKLPMIHAHG